jgi:hypothetical protein
VGGIAELIHRDPSYIIKEDNVVSIVPNQKRGAMSKRPPPSYQEIASYATQLLLVKNLNGNSPRSCARSFQAYRTT